MRVTKLINSLYQVNNWTKEFDGRVIRFLRDRQTKWIKYLDRSVCISHFVSLSITYRSTVIFLLIKILLVLCQWCGKHFNKRRFLKERRQTVSRSTSIFTYWRYRPGPEPGRVHGPTSVAVRRCDAWSCTCRTVHGIDLWSCSPSASPSASPPPANSSSTCPPFCPSVTSSTVPEEQKKNNSSLSDDGCAQYRLSLLYAGSEVSLRMDVVTMASTCNVTIFLSLTLSILNIMQNNV